MEQDSSHKHADTQNFVDSKRAFLKTAKEYGIQTEACIEAFNSPKEFLLKLKGLASKILLHLFHNLKL